MRTKEILAVPSITQVRIELVIGLVTLCLPKNCTRWIFLTLSRALISVDAARPCSGVGGVSSAMTNPRVSLSAFSRAANEQAFITWSFKHKWQCDDFVADLEFRLDYQLKQGRMQNAYLSAIWSHTSYWVNPDVCLFIISHLFPQSKVTWGDQLNLRDLFEVIPYSWLTETKDVNHIHSRTETVFLRCCVRFFMLCTQLLHQLHLKGLLCVNLSSI